MKATFKLAKIYSYPYLATADDGTEYIVIGPATAWAYEAKDSSIKSVDESRLHKKSGILELKFP